MRYIFYILICVVSLFAGCRRDDSSAQTKKLHERLHGKYAAVSSIISEPLDVNMDGMASTDLLSEIGHEFEFCDLELRIIEKDKYLLSLGWPEQFISPNPPPPVNYACQINGRWFSMAGDGITILPKPGDQPLTNSITIEAPDTIKVVMTKKIYAAPEWKTVTVTTVYVRYTMIT